MKTFDYASACQEASKEQGIDEIIEALADLGIKATSEQTGGFTMCAYVQLTASRFIYASPYGASIYSDEEYLGELCEYDEKQPATQIAQDINNYINN